MRCLAKDPASRPQSATELLRRARGVASPSAPQAAMPAMLIGGRAHAPARARGLRRRVRRRRDRREGGDHRHRTSRLGVSRRARRHGARAAGDSVHGVRAVRRAPRGDGDADVHAGRHAVARRRAGHDGDDRDQGEPARVVEAHDARRHRRGRRVRAARRRLHDAARARHRTGGIAARLRQALGERQGARRRVRCAGRGLVARLDDRRGGAHEPVAEPRRARACRRAPSSRRSSK